jgi:CRISPR-associated protein Cas8a1/Csx13
MFGSTPWSPQQKSRTETTEITALDVARLQIFSLALAELPPRKLSSASSITGSTSKPKGKGKSSSIQRRTLPDASTEPQFYFKDSLVRPLVADNLARGQPWYRGFASLYRNLESDQKNKRDNIHFEKKGLLAMIENVPWQDVGESAIVRTVHEAIRCRLGAIAEENRTNRVAFKNRSQGEFDKWRLAFAGAKTMDQFRRSLCDLVSRAGANKVLREHWETVLPWLSDPARWQLTRDLSLLALASYGGRQATATDSAAEVVSDADLKTSE